MYSILSNDRNDYELMGERIARRHRSFDLRMSSRSVATENDVFDGQTASWLIRKHSLLHESLSYTILRIRESHIPTHLSSMDSQIDFSVNPNKWNDRESAAKRVPLASLDVFFTTFFAAIVICIFQYMKEILNLSNILARIKPPFPSTHVSRKVRHCGIIAVIASVTTVAVFTPIVLITTKLLMKQPSYGKLFIHSCHIHYSYVINVIKLSWLRNSSTFKPHVLTTI